MPEYILIGFDDDGSYVDEIIEFGYNEIESILRNVMCDFGYWIPIIQKLPYGKKVALTNAVIYRMKFH